MKKGVHPYLPSLSRNFTLSRRLLALQVPSFPLLAWNFLNISILNRILLIHQSNKGRTSIRELDEISFDTLLVLGSNT